MRCEFLVPLGPACKIDFLPFKIFFHYMVMQAKTFCKYMRDMIFHNLVQLNFRDKIDFFTIKNFFHYMIMEAKIFVGI